MSSTTTNSDLQNQISLAVKTLSEGGVIAYPTEYCFGLGCDPRDSGAVQKILNIKRRSAEQGVILIAGSLSQIDEYADTQVLPDFDAVASTWPGPNTWLLPAKKTVPTWVRGKHSSIAMRIPDHAFCLSLLQAFGHPIVSTSANRSGEKEHLIAASVQRDMGVECDYIIDATVGGASSASTIRDAITGATLR